MNNMNSNYNLDNGYPGGITICFTMCCLIHLTNVCLLFCFFFFELDDDTQSWLINNIDKVYVRIWFSMYCSF